MQSRCVLAESVTTELDDDVEFGHCYKEPEHGKLNYAQEEKVPSKKGQ